MLIILLQFQVNIHSFQDIPIAIPAPINTIPDQILPSHIVVPRCSGEMNFLPDWHNLGHSLANYLLSPAAKFVSKLECSLAKKATLFMQNYFAHTEYELLSAKKVLKFECKCSMVQLSNYLLKTSR